jgi:hypothetical protein
VPTTARREGAWPSSRAPARRRVLTMESPGSGRKQSAPKLRSRAAPLQHIQALMRIRQRRVARRTFAPAPADPNVCGASYMQTGRVGPLSLDRRSLRVLAGAEQTGVVSTRDDRFATIEAALPPHPALAVSETELDAFPHAGGDSRLCRVAVHPSNGMWARRT